MGAIDAKLVDHEAYVADPGMFGSHRSQVLRNSRLCVSLARKSALLVDGTHFECPVTIVPMNTE